MNGKDGVDGGVDLVDVFGFKIKIFIKHRKVIINEILNCVTTPTPTGKTGADLTSEDFVCLFVFYGISTFVGYLMPNSFFFTNKQFYFKQFRVA